MQCTSLITKANELDHSLGLHSFPPAIFNTHRGTFIQSGIRFAKVGCRL